MVMLSPGVKTRELDFSAYAAQASTSTLGIVGGATKGPVNEPTMITSPNNFIRTFGDPTPECLATYGAIQFLQEGNMMWYVRVTDGNEEYADVIVTDGDETAHATATVGSGDDGQIDIEVADFGTEGNDYVVKVEFPTGLEENVEYATAEIGSGDNGTVTVTSDEIGDHTNNYTIEVTTPENLGETADYATAVLNEGETDGEVTITAEEVGEHTNDWNVEVLTGGSEEDLEASFDEATEILTVQLSTDNEENLVAEDNTAELVAAEISSLPEFDASYSGDGSASLDTAENVSFDGADVPDDTDLSASFDAEVLTIELATELDGDTIALDDDANTAELVADEISELSDFTADYSGTGEDALDSEETADFEGAVEPDTYDVNVDFTDPELVITLASTIDNDEVVLDDDANKVSLVAPIIDDLPEFNAEDTGTGEDPLDNEEEVDFEGGSDEPVEIMEIEAKTPGTWANDFEIVVEEIDKQDKPYKISVVTPTDSEQFEVNLDPESDDYFEDKLDGSRHVRAVDLSDGSGTVLEEGTYVLTGGVDGTEDLEDWDIVGDMEPPTGMQFFRNVERYEINILIAPGMSAKATVATEMLDIAESRGDTIAIIDPPFGYDVQDVVEWHNGDGEGEDDPAQALNSSYGTMYWPWLKMADQFERTERWVPPSGYAAAQYARNDRVSYPWFAPAGLKRGRLIRALDLETSPNQGDRDFMYSGGNAVNPIVNFPQDGITIWGQRTLQRQPTALDRVNVRRLLLVMRRVIAGSTRYVVFEPNDEFTWNSWRGLVEPYLESIKRARGLYDFFVQMDEEVVTDYDIDQNRMPGKVHIKPTRSAEFIPIDFVIHPTGAEFPESS